MLSEDTGINTTTATATVSVLCLILVRWMIGVNNAKMKEVQEQQTKILENQKQIMHELSELRKAQC